jgi:hypothetical protein
MDPDIMCHQAIDAKQVVIIRQWLYKNLADGIYPSAFLIAINKMFFYDRINHLQFYVDRLRCLAFDR